MGNKRFHLAGHDWGGSIAWGLADRHSERIASLTILSRPHPNAFNRALQIEDGDQAHRSRHHKAFLEPGAADIVLADDARWLREAVGGQRRAAIRHRGASCRARQQAGHGSRACLVSRARAIRGPLGPIRVPTLYIWGDADDTVGRIAADGTRDFIAAPYRFEVLRASGILPPTRRPIGSAKLMLEHIRTHPA